MGWGGGGGGGGFSCSSKRSYASHRARTRLWLRQAGHPHDSADLGLGAFPLPHAKAERDGTSVERSSV